MNIHRLTLHTTEGRTLLHNISLNAVAPQWLLLDGPSGIGKSTLLRTLAGLWPYYQGSFILGSRRILFLPQHLYLPQDNLRTVISYPHPSCTDNLKIHYALQQVGLEYLANAPDQEQEWHKILSGGEQQRLSLARVLLNPPEILFLDKATNQLDNTSARALMQTLKHHLPNYLCIEISHQTEIKALFDQIEDLSSFIG